MYVGAWGRGGRGVGVHSISKKVNFLFETVLAGGQWEGGKSKKCGGDVN